MKDVLYPLRRLHGMMYEAWLQSQKKKEYMAQFRGNPDAVFLVLTPTHGNLGDHAIAEAEKTLLEENDIPFYEVTDKELQKLKSNRILGVFNGKTILFNGGGNLGTLWFNVEELTREIIQKNPRSKILILPNTFYYESSEWGEQEKKNSITIYNKHRKLKIYARENASYEAMRAIYKDVELVPDMVLRMNQGREGIAREGCILCLRKDIERTRSETFDSKLHDIARGLFGERVTEKDMVVDYRIPLDERSQELEQQYDAFRHAELVITDRLHGMIFAAITGTPCIVINSKSPKVRGCYEWIKDLNYIRFCEDVETIEQVWSEIPKEDHKYPVEAILPRYDSLERELQSLIKKRR